MMTDLFALGFLQRALVAGILVSLLCGVLSTFVVLRRMAFIGVGISHSAFGGVALGFLLGVEPRILILDEPTVSLDACVQDDILELVNTLREKLNLTVLIVSHDIGAVARHMDDVVCINRRIHVHQRPPIGRLGLESTFGCAVEYLFHGEIPHRVVKTHDD